jgi:hypothetical protein
MCFYTSSFLDTHSTPPGFCCVLQLATIAELAAPEAWQTLNQAPKGRPDVLPTMLACPPKTAEEEAAEQQQQQQQQQQAAADGNAQNDDMPALV